MCAQTIAWLIGRSCTRPFEMNFAVPPKYIGESVRVLAGDEVAIGGEPHRFDRG